MNILTHKQPSKRLYWKVAKSTLEAIYRIVRFPKKEAHDLTEAVRELFDNAVIHAYKDEEGIVGHFAMVRHPQSNIVEIGIAVVDPKFKGIGIMKEMFHLLLKKAKELGLSALFGEAITFHPYSQRANARFGFCTTALMLGEIHQMVRLKDHPYPFKNSGTRGTRVQDPQTVHQTYSHTQKIRQVGGDHLRHLPCPPYPKIMCTTCQG